MRHTLTIFLCLLFCLLATVSTAKDQIPLFPVQATETSEPVGGALAKDHGDVTSIAFWDFESGPDGWTSHDITVGPNYWNVSTFNAANLDPSIPDNHAWWCGDYFPPCYVGELEGGYGPYYNTTLTFSADAPNPNLYTSVRIVADLNVETEEGYDFLTFELMMHGEWEPQFELSGIYSGFPLDVGFLPLTPDDYVDGQIQMRWHFTSDTNTDSADCSYPNDGAAQIDNIEVYFDGVLVSYEDCEIPEATTWIPAGTPGVGDFAQLMTDLEEPTSCSSEINPSTQWIFIDDGVIVPGTGGYSCSSYCFGPGEYVVNPEGGLKGPDFHINNEIWSPPVSINPADEARGLILAYDNFLLLPFDAGIFSTWSVRSTDDPTADPELNPELWSNWGWNGLLMYTGSEPSNYRREIEISQYLVENAAQVQVAIGLFEYGWVWGGDGTDSTPTPYYDNVELLKYENGNYLITADDVDLAQDSWLMTTSWEVSGHQLRFDSARNTNTNPAWDTYGIAGDSLVVTVTPLRVSSPAIDSVKMHYVLLENPVYPQAIRNDPDNPIVCWTTDSTEYYADFGDDVYGWSYLFPGDVMHYYFEVEDVNGSFSYLPADRTGYGDFSETSPYPEKFTWRGLPTIQNETFGCPTTLLWDDSGRTGSYNNWPEAMSATGLDLGVDYDIFRTTAPRYNQKNALGRANFAVLYSYDTIVYAGGNNWYSPLEYDDLRALNDFIRNGGNLILSGNHAVSSLEPSFETTEFLSYLDVTSTTSDVAGATGSPVLTATALPGNGVFTDGETWTVSSEYCSVTFDGLTIDVGQYSDSVSLADYATGGFTAASLAEGYVYGAYSVYVFPYDLNYVTDSGKGHDKSALLMSQILEKVFTSLDYGPVSTFLHTCDFSVTDGAVLAQWQTGIESQVGDFRLEARNSSESWTVPCTQNSASSFSARDNSSLLKSGGTFEYTLFHRNDADSWQILYETEIEVSQVPRVTALIGAFPNPFNPSTSISFSLDRQQQVEVSIYDVSGRQVITLIDNTVAAGNHTVLWNGDDGSGRRASSGTYFVKMRTENKEESEKIMLIK